MPYKNGGKMTQSKIRCEQAIDFADCFYNRTEEEDEFETCVMAWQEGYDVGFNGAEKQYLGEIQELKKQAKPHQCIDAEREIIALKADLESAVGDLEKVKIFHDHIIGKEKRVDWGSSFVDWGILNEGLMALDKTISTLKSKLGRG